MRLANKNEQDYYSYISLMSEFGDMSNFSLTEYLEFIKFNNSCCKLVLFYEEEGKVVGTLTLIFDYKPFHKAFAVHVEDVVVSKEHRGRGIGKKMVSYIVNKMNSFEYNGIKSYKLILTCKESNVGFYESCGFSRNEIEMRLNV